MLQIMVLLTERFFTAWRKRLEERKGAVAALPGVAGSLLLHGLAFALILYLVTSRSAQKPEPPFVPVDIFTFGEETTSPPALTRAPVPLAKAMHGPTSAPKPEGVSPKGARPVQDVLEERLKNLANLRQPDSNLKIETEGASDIAATNGDVAGATRYSVRDYIRAQILRRWNLDLKALGDRRVQIALHLRIKANGAIDEIAILDRQRYKRDIVWRDIALSARNAAILSAPFKLPENVPPSALTFTLTLDPRDTLK